MLIERKIKKNLNAYLQPVVLNILNESAQHRKPRGSETHFRIEVVSEQFYDVQTIKRHRFVQTILKNELSLIKAFSLHTFTPQEWETKKMKLERSPSCRGSLDA